MTTEAQELREAFHKELAELIVPGADLWTNAIKVLFADVPIDDRQIRWMRERFKAVFYAIYRLRAAQLAFESIDYLQRLEDAIAKHGQQAIVDDVMGQIKSDTLGPSGMRLSVG